MPRTIYNPETGRFPTEGINPQTGSPDWVPFESGGASNWAENAAIRTGAMMQNIGSEAAEQIGRLSENFGGYVSPSLQEGAGQFVAEREHAQLERNARIDALSREQPLQGIAGDVMSFMTLPAKGSTGAIATALEALSRGNTPMEKGVNAALGLAGLRYGKEAAKELQGIARQTKLGGGTELDKLRLGAVGRLKDKGFKLTRGQKYGRQEDMTSDLAYQTAMRRMPFEGENNIKMNRLLTDAIGETSDVVTNDYLGKQAKRIGSVFESVRICSLWLSLCLTPALHRGSLL